MIPLAASMLFSIFIYLLLAFMMWLVPLLPNRIAWKNELKNIIRTVRGFVILLVFIYLRVDSWFISQKVAEHVKEIEQSKKQTYLVDTQIASDIVAPAGSRIEYNGDPSYSDATVYFQKPVLIAGVLFERLEWFTDDRKPCDTSSDRCADRFITGIIPMKQNVFGWQCVPGRPVLLRRQQGTKPWLLEECMLGKQVAARALGNNMAYRLDHLMRPVLHDTYDSPRQLELSGLLLEDLSITFDNNIKNVVLVTGVTLKDGYLRFEKSSRTLKVPADSVFEYSDAPRSIMLYDKDTQERSSKEIPSGFSIIAPTGSIIRLNNGQSFDSTQEVFLDEQGLYLWHEHSDKQAKRSDIKTLILNARAGKRVKLIVNEKVE